MLTRILFILLIASTQLQAQDSLNIKLLYHWDDTTLKLASGYGTQFRYNEIWGMVVNGREYGVIGSTEGTHIFDVTDPVNATQVAYVPGNYDRAIHRDYHDYNGYLYMVSDEGPATLQIADLSYLPDSVSLVYDSNEFFSRSHNIFIDSTSGYLYSNYGQVLTLEDPANPEFASVPGVHGHDLFALRDTLYVNQEFDGLYIYDHTDPENPQLLGSLTQYPDKGYNHSGWLTDDGNIYAFSDETYGTDIKICDVSDPSDIQVISRVNSGGATTAMPHNVLIRGNFMYVAYYHDGLYVYDISDPYAPTVAGYYDTHPASPAPNYNGAWGVYPFLPSGNVLVSDTRNGFFVLDVGDIISKTEDEVIADIDFKVFPNPTNGEFTVTYHSPESADVGVELYDLQGKRVNQFSVDNHTIQDNKIQLTIRCEEMPVGMYILKLRDGEKTGIRKIFIVM